MSEQLSLFFSSWELFREPALAGLLAGALLGYLGVYVVLRRMVFLSAALSQSAGLGVTFAFYAQIHLGLAPALASPVLFSTLATLSAALLLLVEERPLRLRRESALGAAYLVGGAGALALGTRIVQEAHDIESILFGSAVAIVPESFRLLVGTVVVLFGLHLWWRRGFLQASFDREGARVRGLPVPLLEVTLLASLAVAISVGTRTLGALPVFAFSVLPAVAALRVCANVPRALVLALVFGALSGFVGYVVAFLYELPVGASQTLTAAALVVVTTLAARITKRRP